MLPAEISNGALFRVMIPVTYERMMVLNETTMAKRAIELSVPRTTKMKIGQMTPSAVS